jgi:hypothetical protein
MIRRQNKGSQERRQFFRRKLVEILIITLSPALPKVLDDNTFPT